MCSTMTGVHGCLCAAPCPLGVRRHSFCSGKQRARITDTQIQQVQPHLFITGAGSPQAALSTLRCSCCPPHGILCSHAIAAFFNKTGHAAQSCLDSFPTIRVCCEVLRRAVRALHCLTSFRSGPHTDKQEPLQSPTQVKRNGYSHSRSHGVTSLRGVTFDGLTSASLDNEAAAAPDISSAAPRSIFSRLSNAGPPRQLCGAHAHTPGCGH